VLSLSSAGSPDDTGPGDIRPGSFSPWIESPTDGSIPLPWEIGSPGASDAEENPTLTGCPSTG